MGPRREARGLAHGSDQVPVLVSAGVMLRMVLGALLVWTGPVIVAAESAVPAPTSHVFQPVVAAFHVHSTVSTGSLSLDQLAERAERLGLDAVILSDNFVLRYEYGLFPLRGVLRKTVALPSVLDYGVDRFLADVAEAQARHPRVLLIPGIEATPHYYWTGSLLHGDLTLHNTQKNVLVLGLARDDYAALPVNGNPVSYHYGWEMALNLTPGLLFAPATWLWRRRTLRTVRVGVAQYSSARRYRTPAVVLGSVGSLLLLNAWPFGQPVFSSYDDQLGYRPYQHFIDAVAQRGGIAVWSMPEARDLDVHSFGPIGSVTIQTNPYPEALQLTAGYTGFGGVYQDTRTVTRPGGVWDEVMRHHLAGQGTRPPIVFGEIAFHTPGQAGIELDQVLTVFWVRDRTASGIVEAIRSGRLYALGQYHKQFGLRLDAFQVECEFGARRAESGETLDPTHARHLAVRVSVSATDKGAHPISVTIIRTGQVIARLTGQTPFEHRFLDQTVPLGEGSAYRLEITTEGGEIVSNPIFVKPVQTG